MGMRLTAGSGSGAPDGGIEIEIGIGFGGDCGVGSSAPTDNETNGMLTPMTPSPTSVPDGEIAIGIEIGFGALAAQVPRPRSRSLPTMNQTVC